MKELTISIISIIGTISTTVFAYLAFRRKDKNEIKVSQRKETELMLDVKYIKKSTERMEEKIDQLDRNYNELQTRLIKVEERLENHVRNSKWMN